MKLLITLFFPLLLLIAGCATETPTDNQEIKVIVVDEQDNKTKQTPDSAPSSIINKSQASNEIKGRKTPQAPSSRPRSPIIKEENTIKNKPLLPIKSPTGRNPRLIWTPQQQAIWQQMKKDFDQNKNNNAAKLYQQIKTNAECGCRWADEGQWATLMYQITGDKKYVALAVKKLQPLWKKNSFGGNEVREHSAERVVMYDWLYPGLTSDERKQFLDMLNRMSTSMVTNKWNPKFPVRVEDSDQTVGVYFGLAFLKLATGDHNPTASTLFNKAFVGGLDATGNDRKTMRNTIKQYADTMGKGGQWIEGSQYNLGTTKLLMMGAQGVKTATGKDHFPEVTKLIPQLAKAQLYELTPDLKQSIQWGDVEDERDLKFHYRISMYGMVAGLVKKDAVGSKFNQLLSDIFDQYGYWQGDYRTRPPFRFFYTYDPYAAKSNWRTGANGYFAPGQGQLYYRDGWNRADTLVQLHIPTKQNYVDHEVEYFADFQMYRNGEWVLTHPIGYQAHQSDKTNSIILGGLSVMKEAKGSLAHEIGDGYAYLVGTQGGLYDKVGSWNPPPTFVDEATRSIFYLSSKGKKYDTLVVYDRIDASAPTFISRYHKDDQPDIKNALALKQLVFHMPVKPTVSAGKIAWQTPKKQHVQIHTLLPSNMKTKIINEKSLWKPSYKIDEDEKKYQVRIYPGSSKQFDTFLNLFHIGKDLSSVKTNLVKGISVEGTIIERPGEDDVVVLFSAVQGVVPPQTKPVNEKAVHNNQLFDLIGKKRLLSKGYAISFTSSAPTTRVFLMDLDAAKPWNVTVDGKTNHLAVSKAGVGKITLKGRGKHMLVVGN